MSRRHKEASAPPPIPLLYQGRRLNDEEFGDAYAALDEFIILEALGDDLQPLGYAIGKITNLYPYDDYGAHITLDYVGAQNEFYRQCVETVDVPGGLPSTYTRHLCRKAISTCSRKEGRRTIHVQEWSSIDKRDAHELLRSWGCGGFVDLRRQGGSKRDPVSEAASHGALPKSKARNEADEEGDPPPKGETALPLRRRQDGVAKAMQASNVLVLIAS